MKVKPSQFNFCYRKDHETIVYNTFTKDCIAVDDTNLPLIQNSYDSSSCDQDSLHFLMDRGFIVDADFDEVAYLKYYNYMVRFASDYLSLTIAPTLSCNFDCPYCFENKRGGVMSSDVQDKVIDFLEEKLKSGVRRMDLTWYGGEPLICFDIIQSLCDRITELTKRYDVKTKMGMITNGFLITDVVAEFLEKNHISVQITIDGMAQNHNERRYLRGGGKTFDTIIQNLHYFDNKEVDVYIRMNVDRHNASDYESLTQLIQSYQNKRMILYPAVTENVNEREESRLDYYMSDNKFDGFIAATRRKGLFHKDVNTVPISNDVSTVPDNRSYFCAAELENSYVIDDRGHVYKCWNEVGKDNFCFSLDNPNKINYKSLLNYMGDIVFEDPRCKKCVFLPICFGGCKFHKAIFNRYACAFNEDSLIAYIEDTLL